MPLQPPENILIVEGATEKRLIPELMEARGVVWTDAAGDFAVTIRNYDGIENILAAGEIEVVLKASGVAAVAVVFDADGLHSDLQTRWESMRNRCTDFGVQLPEQPVAEGFQTTVGNDIRFGVWMMPDNIRRGMLETFLAELIRAEHQALYDFAREMVDEARKRGAPFRPVHTDKARIHTWLAWQHSPGPQLHEAVKFNFLDSSSARADQFVNWFRSVFAV
jgi:hypothetical protein